MPEHALVQLARRAIERYVRDGERISAPDALTSEMRERAGAFVSLHKAGRLRGCIGTTEATQANLAQEVIANAINAATRDPRFPPVRSDELSALDISVDVLGKGEPIDSLGELDPARYGVIVQQGHRRGLLLPDLEGVDTAEQQVEIALRKAWIEPDSDYDLYRFQVQRFH